MQYKHWISILFIVPVVARYYKMIWYYADDMVIISTSFNEMQDHMKKLENYCLKWKLMVNIKKTKVLYTGTKIMPPIKYKNQSLEYVNRFTYLGITITKSGITQTSKLNIVSKAQKAWYKLKRILFSNTIRSPSIALHLFDCCIKPIILYCSEVWGLIDNPQKNLCQLYDSKERLQLHCCKQILNVTRTCPNFGVLGELGRYPLKIEVQMCMIKYWLHLQSLPSDSVLAKIYMKSKNPGGKWYESIKSIFSYLEINIDDVNLPDSNSVNTCISTIKLKMQTHFQKLWTEKQMLF